MNRSESLTPVQEATLSFIRNYIAANKQSPTITELGAGLKLKSLRSVTQRIESLERKGCIARDRFRRRGIRLVGAGSPSSPSPTLLVPVIASAGCDAMDVYAQDEFGEFIAVDRRIVGARTNIAAVKAVGDSMQDAGIHNGDYVIVEVTEHVEQGDRVVAIIGNMAVIKQYQKVDDVVFLHPQNKDGSYYPIVVKQEDSKIFGKVVSVIPGTDWIDDIKIEYYPDYQPKR
jgi:repressor LexA